LRHYFCFRQTTLLNLGFSVEAEQRSFYLLIITYPLHAFSIGAEQRAKKGNSVAFLRCEVASKVRRLRAFDQGDGNIIPTLRRREVSTVVTTQLFK
jgi:hypothetical protein